jgi:hypothetical protein
LYKMYQRTKQLSTGCANIILNTILSSRSTERSELTSEAH